MIPWLLLLPIPVFAISKAHGVPPALVSRYSPLESGGWNCLDGSKNIQWNSVNDDYCDCPDGSDEPGTSACVNGTFYCHNQGHIGTFIPSLRVNDGLCEPECCDGSDEDPGICKNLCKEAGQAYTKQQTEKLKMRKTGSKLRSSYIVFAHKEKKRLEALVASSSQEIAVREKEVARLKDIADRTESLSAAALEQKQKSPLYTSLLIHSRALKSLQREHNKHLEREKTLGDILNTLRSGYNPNYQDMAVLEAVRGWELLAGLPHIGQSEEEGSDEGDTPEPKKEAEPADELEEGMWSASQLEHQLDDLVNSDYVSLLLQHEDHISALSGSFLFDLSAYIPDSFMPQYEDIKETIVSWLQTFGVVRGEGDKSSNDASRARQAFNDAEHSLDLAVKEKETAEADLADLFDVNGFGAEGEWKKLDRTCLEKDTGEYTYEVCLFDEARQKPKKGGSTFSLGRFKSWDVTAMPGTPEFYSKQIYKNGAKCWNGPERSVVLVWTCGTENAIHTVVELEKCEYQFTGTSPALCLPLNNGDVKREEL